MTTTTPEPSSDETVDTLQDSLLAFTGCIGNAFPDVCSYGLTVGDHYVPFTPDADDECEEDEEYCAQVWVRVMDGGVINVSEQSFASGGCGGDFTLQIEVGILRCFETPEAGAAPSATQAMAASLQNIADMRAIYCAAMNCDVWSEIDAGQWQPEGPMGGQYGGTWTFTVTAL